MAVEQFNQDGHHTNEVFLGSWSENYKSWKNYNSVRSLIIKYEDLVLNPSVYFHKIIIFINQINGLVIDEKKINKTIFSFK